MKYYILSYVLNSETVIVRKKFKSRNDAIDYTFKRMPMNTELLYEIERGAHNIEYVCNNSNRFFVSRCVA